MHDLLCKFEDLVVLKTMYLDVKSELLKLIKGD